MPTQTYWNRESRLDKSVFVHWQYTKDRYAWLTQFGANGQDFFADVVQGQHGEDALALAFFSHTQNLWYEWVSIYSV